MARVKRFYLTRCGRSSVVHRCYSATHVEGERTACGRMLTTKWNWARSFPGASFKACLQCEKAHG